MSIKGKLLCVFGFIGIIVAVDILGSIASTIAMTFWTGVIKVFDFIWTNYWWGILLLAAIIWIVKIINDRRG